MIKGSQKQMIVLRTQNSPYFDEAYFVLRREVKPHSEARRDMVCEAERILRENASFPVRTRKRRSLWMFLLGILLGAVVAVAICLFI